MYANFHGELHNGKYVDQELREYFPDYSYKGVFFDVGAFDPIDISNSHHFHMNGWDCYEFEAIPENAKNLSKHRQHVFNYAISDTDLDEVQFTVVHAHGIEGRTASYSAINLSNEYLSIFGWHPMNRTEYIKVPQRKLDTIIRESIPELQRIDIMSLDVEGGELNVLKGLDISKYKPRVIVLENASHSSMFLDYLKPFGYRLDKSNDYNYFFVAE